MSTLQPFFTYFGGKWRAAHHYPAPRYRTIMEPFAGAAGYSVRYPDHDVVLVERDPTIAALWRYLISVDPAEVLALPLAVTTTDALDVPAPARTLIGFWLNKGCSAPCKQPSAWMRSGIRPDSFWGETIRARIAAQVTRIRHWRVVEGTYADAPDVEATWYVDPPYIKAGTNYRYGARLLDYTALAQWCRTRRGQTIVCEADGAAWLPFRAFRTIKASEAKSGGKTSAEVVWLSDEQKPRPRRTLPADCVFA